MKSAPPLDQLPPPLLRPSRLWHKLGFVLAIGLSLGYGLLLLSDHTQLFHWLRDAKPTFSDKPAADWAPVPPRPTQTSGDQVYSWDWTDKRWLPKAAAPEREAPLNRSPGALRIFAELKTEDSLEIFKGIEQE